MGKGHQERNPETDKAHKSSDMGERAGGKRHREMPEETDASGRQDSELPGEAAGPGDSKAKAEAGSRPAGLNPCQQEAVERMPSVAVIAGPGAGKTRTLIARLRHLLEKRGIAPEEITAVTFTNKAAEEMRARMEAESAAETGQPNQLSGNRRGRRATDMQIGTFHAICSRFLQESGLSFVVADEGLQMELAERALREFDGKESPGK